MNHGNYIGGACGGPAMMPGAYMQDKAVMVAEQIKREAEIPRELDRLDRLLKGCAQGLDTLHGKLADSVMRSEPPSDAKAGNASTPAQTPYGSRLQELGSFASMLNDHIQALNARLEV
jgi:hypothetical protein